MRTDHALNGRSLEIRKHLHMGIGEGLNGALHAREIWFVLKEEALAGDQA